VVVVAPDAKDIKALGTALKLQAKFETIERLAGAWIDKKGREKNPKDMDEYDRRKWYDLHDSWVRAVDALKKSVTNFQKETGDSPILGYKRFADKMGYVGKVFLGYDSSHGGVLYDPTQVKGFRIVQLYYPEWFEELGLPTEEMKEDDIYKLVPAQRTSDEQERTLRQSFIEDLREVGIERFNEFMRRYETTIDKMRTYNENVYRVDALVQTIIRERALVVAKPPGGAIVPVTAPKEMPIPRVKVEAKSPVAREVPSEVRVKVRVEEGMNLGEYFAHLLVDGFEATFSGVLSTQALKDYLEEREDYVDFREQLSLQGFSEPKIEEELKKLPAPFSSGEEIKVVWTSQDVEFTAKAREWWDAFNKVYSRPELEAFDWERLKTIAKLKGVKVGDVKAETVAYILGEAREEKTKSVEDRIKELLPQAKEIAATWKEGAYKKDFYSMINDLQRRLGQGTILEDQLQNLIKWMRMTPEERGEAPPAPVPATPTVSRPTPTPERRGLTSSDINKLQDIYSDHLFRQLGRVPTNSLATFRVEIDKVRDKTFSEAEEYILGVADDIVSSFTVREKISRIRPERRVETPVGGQPERGAPMGRVPPAQFPSYPLCYNLPFPRGACSAEKLKLWDVFCFQMQESDYDCMAYQTEFDEYIGGTQFLSWEDLRNKFNTFIQTIKEGLGLPPLFTWRGVPIPTGLKGEIQEHEPLERLEDLVTHFSSVVIRNARARGNLPTLTDLKIELLEHNVIPESTAIPELREVAKAALTHALDRKDLWVSGISSTEINDFLASD